MKIDQKILKLHKKAYKLDNNSAWGVLLDEIKKHYNVSKIEYDSNNKKERLAFFIYSMEIFLGCEKLLYYIGCL